MDGSSPQPKGATVQIQQPPPLNPTQRQQWNDFVDFLDKNGMKGNQLLDDRDKHLGQYLFAKYKSQTPNLSITYDDVPRVQQALQDHRNEIITQYKKGNVKFDNTVKSEDDIMPNLSKTDGWLGSKTSSHKFPVAVMTANNNGNVATTNYGTDIEAYNRQHPIYKKP